MKDNDLYTLIGIRLIGPLRGSADAQAELRRLLMSLDEMQRRRVAAAG